MSAADVVKAAAAKGFNLSDKFVHTIRYNAKLKAGKTASKVPAGAAQVASFVTKRRPGRPRKAATAGEGVVGGGIIVEIEHIVERAVGRVQSERLRALRRLRQERMIA